MWLFRWLIIALLSLVCFCAPANAQRNTQYPGVMLSLKYSYSGLNLGANISWQRDGLQAYAGPVVNLNRGRLLGSTPWGINGGVAYRRSLGDSHFGQMLNLDYQAMFFKQASRNDRIQELYLNYGVSYSPIPKLHLVQLLGLGAYWEKGSSALSGESTTTSGLHAMLNFRVSYDLGGE